MRRLVIVLVLVAAAATAPGSAVAADECRGLLVCLPVAGPWVAVPAPGGNAARVDYLLRCPRRNYIVAGVDARLADAEIDVSFRGETGAPVAPGVTTRGALLFSAVSTAASRRPTSFQPFIGCVPTSGGGGRAQTSYTATPPGGLRPTEPIERRVVTRRLATGVALFTVRCPSGARLLDGSHAVAFRTGAAPSSRVLSAVRVKRSLVGGAVVARVTVASGGLGGARAELQLHAVCRKAAP